MFGSGSGSLGFMFAPSRGRELKLAMKGDMDKSLFVRPLAGAGIEIFRADNKKLAAERSPPRGGGN